jgi:CBS domain-containing protein
VLLSPQRTLSTLTVSDVMTTDLFTIGPDADESDVRQQVAQAQVDRLLVMGGRSAGRHRLGGGHPSRRGTAA